MDMFGGQSQVIYGKVNGVHLAKGAKIQRSCGKTFNIKFPPKRPKWLKNPETRYLLEIDGLNEKLGLGFEFQGE